MQQHSFQFNWQHCSICCSLHLYAYCCLPSTYIAACLTSKCLFVCLSVQLVCYVVSLSVCLPAYVVIVSCVLLWSWYPICLFRLSAVLSSLNVGCFRSLFCSLVFVFVVVVFCPSGGRTLTRTFFFVVRPCC